MPSTSPGHRPPSMADVAKVAGVSHQTVSRVINESGVVRPETRDRILEVIEQLGYRPNEMARMLATRRSKLIGIITPNFSHYGPASTLLSVQLAAHDQGYMVSVATLSEFTAQSLRQALDQFLGQGVAGIVVIAPVEQIARELEHSDLRVPTIAVASSWISTSSSIARVGVEQRGGIKQGIRRLADEGCHTIAHLAGPKQWFDAQEREAAWKGAIADLGLAAGPMLRGNWSAEDGFVLAGRLMDMGLPDALFAGNDRMALGALRAFAEAGVSVPRDIRVLGFDDEDTAAYYFPSLTTVRQDFHRLGYEAIEVLLQRFDGAGVADRMIPTELRVRASA